MVTIFLRQKERVGEISGYQGSNMSQSSSSYTGGSAAPDFHLPDEILSVIPTDPYEQLDLARKITSMAIASRVLNLESEMRRMHHKVQEKDGVIAELEQKVSQLESSFEENENRLKMALDENMKLQKERDSLAAYAKKLNRDLTKLEAFKRQLIQSLNDDNSPKVENVNQSASKASADGEGTNGFTAQHSFSGYTETSNRIDDASKQAGPRFSTAPCITSRLTPTETPKTLSVCGSPKGFAAESPQLISGMSSPTNSHFDGQSSVSSWYPSSQQSSTASSPSHSRSLPARMTRIDGKEFFRQARSRLSYEQFSAFLANIKELNAQRQSREETLRKAQEIFGMDKNDLYLSFQGLLNRSAR